MALQMSGIPGRRPTSKPRSTTSTACWPSPRSCLRSNQVEVHPYFQQTDLQRIHGAHGIVTRAWSPIGGITSYGGADKSTFDDPTLLEIARQHDKSAAQVMLRWHLQEGRAAIPKIDRIGLDSRGRTHHPPTGCPGRCAVGIRHLLGHRAGLRPRLNLITRPGVPDQFFRRGI